MQSTEYTKAGKYVRSTDPAQFKNICSIINSRSLVKVGIYLECVDPEMFAVIQDEE